jgi:hypothetical protein
MTGVLVLVATLALATVAGLVMKARNGRVRLSGAADLPADVRSVLAPDGVTLVQLSSTFCAPCRHTRVLLSDLASRTDGLHHTELDLTAAAWRGNWLSCAPRPPSPSTARAPSCCASAASRSATSCSRRCDRTWPSLRRILPGPRDLRIPRQAAASHLVDAPPSTRDPAVMC